MAAAQQGRQPIRPIVQGVNCHEHETIQARVLPRAAREVHDRQKDQAHEDWIRANFGFIFVQDSTKPHGALLLAEIDRLREELQQAKQESDYFQQLWLRRGDHIDGLVTTLRGVYSLRGEDIELTRLIFNAIEEFGEGEQ